MSGTSSLSLLICFVVTEVLVVVAVLTRVSLAEVTLVWIVLCALSIEIEATTCLVLIAGLDFSLVARSVLLGVAFEAGLLLLEPKPPNVNDGSCADRAKSSPSARYPAHVSVNQSVLNDKVLTTRVALQSGLGHERSDRCQILFDLHLFIAVVFALVHRTRHVIRISHQNLIVD